MSDGHQPWSEDVAAYLLGALDPQQSAALEAHLDSCERCRQELRWLSAAVDTLPESVERKAPPPQLRERLLAEVERDVQGAGAGAREAAPPRSRRTGLRLGSFGWRPAAAVATLLVAVAVAVAVLVSQGGSGERSGTVTVRQGGVTATVSREGDAGSVRLANVHQLPDGRVLEAWVERDGAVEAVPALFVPNRDGDAATTIADLSEVEAVMVTVEPKGGSPQPTSKPIVEIATPE